MKNKPLQFIPAEINSALKFTETEQQVLDFINQKIAAGTSLEETLSFLYENTGRIMSVDRVSVSFFEEGGSRMTLYHAVAGYSPLYLDNGYTADTRGSSLEKVFDSKMPRIINDLDAHYRNRAQSESTALLLKEGILSSMTCPLKVEGRPVGLLFFSSKKRNAYSDRDIALHLAIAERLGQAVEKVWRIRELSQSINSYMEMLGFVSHELKSPLDSLITLGQTLTAGYLGEMDEKQLDYVERMIKKAQYLRDMTAQYLTLSRFESSSMQIKIETVDFEKDILAESLDIIRPQLAEKKMKIETDITPGLQDINCDPGLIKIVMNNLLSNAVKYGNAEGTVSLKAGIKGPMLAVSVRNSGPGFPESQKVRLFKKFSRIESPELMQRKGTGVGLYTSWKIIQLHRGGIRADSEEGNWAEFTFEIPVNGESSPALQ